MSEPDNPPAFPMGYDSTGDYNARYGMSLRDYFAAKAMQGILASCPEGMRAEKISQNVLLVWAKNSYAIATQMLRARETHEE